MNFTADNVDAIKVVDISYMPTVSASIVSTGAKEARDRRQLKELIAKIAAQNRRQSAIVSYTYPQSRLHNIFAFSPLQQTTRRCGRGRPAGFVRKPEGRPVAGNAILMAGFAIADSGSAYGKCKHFPAGDTLQH